MYLITIGSFPPDVTGAIIRGSAFSVNAARSLIVAHRFKARVQVVDGVTVFGFLPTCINTGFYRVFHKSRQTYLASLGLRPELHFG